MSRWTRGLDPARAPAQTLDSSAFDFAGRKTVNEHDSKQLIATLGVRVTEERIVASAEAAIEAARSIGFPVVMKAASDDIAHKTEHGLVKIGLADAAAVEATWADLQSILTGLGAKSDILVQEMVTDGIEVFAGVAYHEGFGHALAFGMGGVEIEVTRDFALRMLPLRDGDAEAMIGEIRAAARLGPQIGRAHV